MFICAKYTSAAFSFFMALLMSCVMSMVITLTNLGVVEGLFVIWLKAWGSAFIVSFPTIVMISPLVKRLVALVIKVPSQNSNSNTSPKPSIP